MRLKIKDKNLEEARKELKKMSDYSRKKDLLSELDYWISTFNDWIMNDDILPFKYDLKWNANYLEELISRADIFDGAFDGDFEVYSKKRAADFKKWSNKFDSLLNDLENWSNELRQKIIDSDERIRDELKIIEKGSRKINKEEDCLEEFVRINRKIISVLDCDDDKLGEVIQDESVSKMIFNPVTLMIIFNTIEGEEQSILMRKIALDLMEGGFDPLNTNLNQAEAKEKLKKMIKALSLDTKREIAKTHLSYSKKLVKEFEKN